MSGTPSDKSAADVRAWNRDDFARLFCERAAERQATACGHRSPLNYDHTRWAQCSLPTGHDGEHRQGELGWRTGFMPCKVGRG